MWQGIVVGAIVLLAAVFAGYRLFYKKGCGCAGCDGCRGKIRKPGQAITPVDGLSHKNESSCNCGGER